MSDDNDISSKKAYWTDQYLSGRIMILESEKMQLLGALSMALDEKRHKLYRSELLNTLRKFKDQ